MARCPTVIKELRSHFFSSDWMLVIKGFSHLIENVCSRVEQLLFIESNLDMEVWLDKWKERYMEKKLYKLYLTKIHCGWIENFF